MSPRHPPLDVELIRLPEERVFEFVRLASTPDADWNGAPGHVDVADDGSPRRLHFAPRRWLVPSPDERLLEQLRRADAEGAATCVDVTGKWVALRVEGVHGERALASTIDLGAVLADRACAAVTLFDCPSIVARDGTGLRVWVAASYVQAFEEAVARLQR